LQQIDDTEQIQKTAENISNPSDNPPDADATLTRSAPERPRFHFRSFSESLSRLSLPETDDLERRSSLITLMIAAVIAFMVVVVPVIVLLGLFLPIDFWVISIVLIGCIAGYILNQYKRIHLAGYIFLFSIVSGLLLRSLNGRVESNLLTVVFNYYALVGCIAFAGLIIDEYSPFLVAIAGNAAFIILFLSESPRNFDQIVQTVATGAGLHLVVAVMSWANARAIKNAMRRMAWQTNEVVKINDQLENNLAFDTEIGDVVGTLSGDLNQISYDQSDRAQSQAQSVAIVTSTLEELSATARQIADVAEGVFTATEQALRTAESGGQSVGLGIDSIATLTGQVESISKIASELGNQSRKISEIVETITDIAEETNLLALNATIEAAGAGEYGKRFSVVAQEVQTLATRSRQASRDVQAILGQIRNSISNTLFATDKGLEEARRMSEVAGQAGEAIEQIIETVESTTFLARQIYLTTQQQRTATDQAVEMIRQVANDSRESAARARQLLAASEKLNQTASRLRRD
jgi:methyl-accepting chemotaxis protein